MWSLILFLFVTLLVLFLGGVVYVHDMKAKTHQYFLLWVILIVGWMVSSYLENFFGFPHSIRTLFIRLDFFLGPLAQAPLALFVLNFINPKVRPVKEFVSVLPALLTSLLTLTSWHIATVFFADTGEIRFTEGPAFIVFVIVTTIYFVVPCILLLMYRRHAEPQLKGQATSIAIGLAATTIVLLGINLFLQNVLNVEQFRIGIYSMLFFVIGVVYAIARHSFLQIRVVLVEILLLAILAMLLTRVILSQSTSEMFFTLASFLVMLILGFAMVRSFLNEVKQKEELEALSSELAHANSKLLTSNRELKQSKAREIAKARDVAKLKDEFVFVAAHELRTPVTAISGFVNLIETSKIKLPKVVHSYLDEVEVASKHLRQLVNDLLEIARGDAGTLKVAVATVDVPALCNEVMGEFSSLAKEKKLQVSCNADIGSVLADATKLKEVLANLVSNAIKYNRDAGKVELRLRPDGASLAIEVADTGVGIPRDQQDKIFQKFFRVKSTTTDGVEGTGLGLFVARMLVEKMGGAISFTSQEGKGTTFRVSLPMAGPIPDSADPKHGHRRMVKK